MNGENRMQEERMIISFDGTKLRLKKDAVENPKALIVIAHGLCEHLNRYDYFTEKLNENGYSVYRYDQRGHGKSEGKKVYFKDFNEMPDDLGQILALAREESEGKKVFLFGHSMGGETVTLFGTKNPGMADGIITSGAQLITIIPLWEISSQLRHRMILICQMNLEMECAAIKR